MSKTKLLMRRDGGCLRPEDRYSWDVFDTIRTSKPVVVTVHQARNPDHLKKYWTLATIVADNDPHFVDRYHADEWCKVRMGRFTEYKDVDGQILIRTESIAIESMGQLDFNQFYDTALALWSERLGVDVDELLVEAQDLPA